MLDFQLKSHEKYLRKFIALFKSVDTDTNGALNEMEFKQLTTLMSICQSEDEIGMLLEQVDPNSNQKITFSECLTLFSSQKVQNEKTTMLEKFISENDPQ